VQKKLAASFLLVTALCTAVAVAIPYLQPDPFWGTTYTYDEMALLGMLKTDAGQYVAAFPDQAALVQPFLDAIATEQQNAPASTG